MILSNLINLKNIFFGNTNWVIRRKRIHHFVWENLLTFISNTYNFIQSILHFLYNRRRYDIVNRWWYISLYLLYKRIRMSTSWLKRTHWFNSRTSEATNFDTIYFTKERIALNLLVRVQTTPMVKIGVLGKSLEPRRWIFRYSTLRRQATSAIDKVVMIIHATIAVTDEEVKNKAIK